MSEEMRYGEWEIWGGDFGHEVKEVAGHEKKEAKQDLSFGTGRAPELITKWNGNNKITKVL